MDDALACAAPSASRPRDDVTDSSDRESSALLEARADCLALEPLHHDELFSRLGLAHVEHVDDAGVIDDGARACFLAEPRRVPGRRHPRVET